MSATAVQPFSGTYRAQSLPSSFSFAVRHSGVFWYRGSLSEVAATLRGDGDGRAEVDGELTIRGVTRPVSASGHYAAPRQASFGEVAGLQLKTRFDRREFGFDWQMPLPGGGVAVGWYVEVDIDLLLIREDAEGVVK